MGLGNELLRAGIISDREREVCEDAIAKLQSLNPPSLLPSVGEVIKAIYPDKADAIESFEGGRRESWKDPALLLALDQAFTQPCILLVGAGFSLAEIGRGRTDGLLGRDIVSDLLKDIPEVDRLRIQGASLHQVADYYLKHFGDQALTAKLVQLCRRSLPRSPLLQHRILASLSCFRFIITTNWDRLIETAFADLPENRLNVVRCDDEVPVIDYVDKVTLVKPYGDFNGHSFVERPLVTSDEIRGLEGKCPFLKHLLETLFATHTVITIGFNDSDDNFRHLLDFAHRSRGAKKVYSVDPADILVGSIDDKSRIRMTSTQFLEALNTYHHFDGARSAISYSTPLKHRGAIAVWNPTLCEVADEIRDRYPHLARVNIVESAPAEAPEDVKHRVARRAASVLKESVRPGIKVAMSCGSTLAALVKEANDSWKMFRDVTLSTTGIAIADDDNAVAPAALVALLASRLGSLGVRFQSYHLPPSLLSSLVEDSFTPHIGFDVQCDPKLRGLIAQQADAVRDADVILLGVGAMGVMTTGFTRYARCCFQATPRAPNESPAEAEILFVKYLRAMKNADLDYVGDLANRPFKEMDLRSGPIDVSTKFMCAERLIECFEKKSLSMRFKEFLVRILFQYEAVNPVAFQLAARDPHRVVAIAASGDEKAIAVRSLLNAELCDTVIIDRQLAKAVLDH